MPKRICIVGGGASGLSAIKACLEQNLEPVCYEWTKNIGGLWRYREEDVHGLGSVMRSTIINSSKEVSAFSDFPPPKEYPNYMHNSKMIRYIEMYAKKFGLVQYIQFEHEVKSIEQTADYDDTGRWTVTAQKVGSAEPFQEVFDGVMVCAGHHVFPIIPKFPGQEEFQGNIIHTHSYKKPNGYDDKKVLVVGVGNSGGDVAVELSNIASQVYLSTRRGAWVIHRVGPKGKPFDLHLIKRFLNFFFNNLPYPIVCAIVEREINNRFDHELYRMKPTHHIFGQHPMVNDALPNRILSGTVEVKGDIKEFTAKGVIFEGENEEIAVDEVVLATGYKIYFPYLSKDIVWVEDNQVELFKFAFPPKLKHQTLVLIGLGQPVGPLMPISELQSRVFALHMAGKINLPSEEEMMRDVRRKDREMKKRYFSGPRHTIQVDWINYMDELADLAGVKPDLTSMFFNDPLLFYQCVFGSCVPYQYRLKGPNAWAGAREALLTVDERVVAALDTRKMPKQKTEELNILKILMASISIVLLAMVLAMVA
ncbi:flavin-containing monooxygenase 5 [Parasteatoda tepidariorum]|uniref:flavin-containing monooxygenase 5 n=1 Tax=Parasteatoda tepidariorum TaxID=114398 RepID=UPI001C71FAF9|nr:flavin-containing monooxygenase 5 [Parasteatoda tepidariorum]